MRMNGHRLDHHCNLPDQPVAVHFNLVDHAIDDLSILVIEQVWRDDPAYRKLQESYWIHTLVVGPKMALVRILRTPRISLPFSPFSFLFFFFYFYFLRGQL